VGLILSWSVGLLPAIIYRYFIFKKPIEKKRIFFLLAPIVVILAFVFKLLVASISGADPNPNPIPWIIIYYIGKWIMVREPKRTNAPTQASHSQAVEGLHKPRMSRFLLVFFVVVAIGLIVGLCVGGWLFLGKAQKSMKESPLAVAVVSGNIENVNRLITEGADINKSVIMGHTPLIMATYSGFPLIAEQLLKAGADPNQRDNLKWAPLHHAIKASGARLNLIKILLQHGADVDIRDSRLRTPLHRAAQFGHYDAAKMLLDNGADPNAKDKYDLTPSDRGENHSDILKLLNKYK